MWRLTEVTAISLLQRSHFFTGMTLFCDMFVWLSLLSPQKIQFNWPFLFLGMGLTHFKVIKHQSSILSYFSFLFMSLLLFFISGQNRIFSIKRTILCQLYNTTIKIEYCDFMFPCGGTFIAEKRVNEIHKVIHFDNSIYATCRKNVILALHRTVF